MAHTTVQRQSSTAHISVIIPSYRSARTLPACLAAITRQRTAWRYDVIVVHSGPEPLADAVRRAFPNVRFYTFAEQWLPGKARNWALRLVQTPWVMFLDSDCVACADWIETMMGMAIEHGLDGAGGAVRNATTLNPFAWTMHLLEFGEWLPGGPFRQCENFPSCNALYRRDCVLEAGGFPEELFPCEDTVLNYMLCRKGYRLGFVPAAAVDHIHHKNLAGLLRHNYAHGLTYGRACRTYPLPGNLLTRLAPAALILIAPVRFGRIAWRLGRGHPVALLILLLLMPLALAALIAWGTGFAAARQYAPLIHTG